MKKQEIYDSLFPPVLFNCLNKSKKVTKNRKEKKKKKKERVPHAEDIYHEIPECIPQAQKYYTKY